MKRKKKDDFLPIFTGALLIITFCTVADSLLFEPKIFFHTIEVSKETNVYLETGTMNLEHIVPLMEITSHVNSLKIKFNNLKYSSDSSHYDPKNYLLNSHTKAVVFGKKTTKALQICYATILTCFHFH